MRAKIRLSTISGTSRDAHRSDEKRATQALIDSGSDHSLIKFDLLPRAVQIDIDNYMNANGHNRHNIKLHKHAVIKTINGETISDTISITLFIRIGEWCGPIDLIVLQDIPHEPFIIGSDFLDINKAKVDYEDRSLSLEKSSPVAFCHSSKVVWIKANHEGHIEAEVPRRFNNHQVLVQTIDHSAKSFSIASSIHTVQNNRITVRYVNAGTTTRISKMQPLAEITLLDDVDVIDFNPDSSSTDDFESKLNINEKLTDEERSTLIELLKKHKSAFSSSSNDRGKTGLVEHQIRLNSSVPTRKPPYRVPPLKRQIISEKVDEMIRENVIEPSISPFAAPVVLVKKKSGEWRFCVDYRDLNGITVQDAYPLPRIDDSLDALRGNSYFSILDMLSGFWQIPVVKNDRDKTAFVTPDGLFQFKVMPFGLTNSPATFQRLMDRVLSGLTWSRAIVYMDDIIVFGRTFEEHNANLEAVLTRIKLANLKLNLDKCKFGETEVIYLGHRITQNGIGVDPAKIDAINRVEEPSNRAKLRRFLGMANYYKRFVYQFSVIAAPLNALTSTRKEFEWREEARKAFIDLKKALSSTPVLRAPDFSKPFQLSTDASKVGIGAVLEQEGQPIAYASRTCSVAEQNYQATEQEALAVIWSVRYFRHYLYGRDFTIYTDHKALHDLKSNRHPDEPLGRLMLKLQGYNYKIEYKPGKQNCVADVLSRDVGPASDQVDYEIEMREPVINNFTNNQLKVNTIEFSHDWHALQAADNEISLVRTALEQGQSDKSTEFTKDFSRLNLLNGLVCRGHRICVPKKDRISVIRLFHENHGHEQSDQLTQRLRNLFFWPRMQPDITDFVQRCDECQRTKTSLPPRPPLGQITSSDVKPLQFWSIDFQGPFVTSNQGNRYIVVAVDYASKWVEAKATPDCTAVTTAKFILDQIIHRHGPPENIHTDQGTNFESKLIHELCETYKIKKSRSSAYHPEGDGAVERENRSIKELIRPYTIDNQDEWDENLSLIIHARNTSVHATTGFTPFELVYARKPSENLLVKSNVNEPTSEYIQRLVRAREQVEETAKKSMQRKLEKQRVYYNQNYRLRNINLKTGDKVLVKNESTHPGFSKKLEPKFYGPMTVLEVHDQHLIVEYNSERRPVHKSKVRKYNPPHAEEQPEQPEQRLQHQHQVQQSQQNQRPTRLIDSTAISSPKARPAQYTTRTGRVSRPPVRFADQLND